MTNIYKYVNINFLKENVKINFIILNIILIIIFNISTFFVVILKINLITLHIYFSTQIFVDY